LNVNPFEVTLAPTKVGIFRSGLWMLDVNGNGVFDAGVDKSFNWGYPGTTRVQGDWNGDGKQKAGLYIGLCAGICGEGRIAGFGLG
jgi:hypothetical protein